MILLNATGKWFNNSFIIHNDIAIFSRDLKQSDFNENENGVESRDTLLNFNKCYYEDRMYFNIKM